MGGSARQDAAVFQDLHDVLVGEVEEDSDFFSCGFEEKGGVYDDDFGVAIVVEVHLPLSFGQGVSGVEWRFLDRDEAGGFAA